jgi:hypothetical protein
MGAYYLEYTFLILLVFDLIAQGDTQWHEEM